MILDLEHVADQRRLPPNPPDVILVAVDYAMRGSSNAALWAAFKQRRQLQ